MISKRDIKNRLSRMRRIKMWQLLVILFFGILVAATLLRLNNLGMIEKRDAVIAADESGDKQNMRSSLIELQHYVSSHMNTSLGGGVYLSHQYDRDRDEALKAASSTSNPNSAVYQQASVECRSRFQGGVESFRNDYVQCVIDRVKALSSVEDPLGAIKLPRAENYRYDFVSPVWSPDLAGFVVLFCGIVLLVIVSRFFTTVVLRWLLKRRFLNT